MLCGTEAAKASLLNVATVIAAALISKPSFIQLCPMNLQVRFRDWSQDPERRKKPWRQEEGGQLSHLRAPANRFFCFQFQAKPRPFTPSGARALARPKEQAKSAACRVCWGPNVFFGRFGSWACFSCHAPTLNPNPTPSR